MPPDNAMNKHDGGPLSGIRILDLSRLAPGPFATTLLGDLGADVITVEPPDDRRPGAVLDTVPAHGGARARARGLNPLFRSRRSIVIDLKATEGRDTVLHLARSADVFLEGFRPGVCDRLGVGYSDITAVNSRIVYCSLSGYGQTGPLAERVGHDLNYLAESGALSASTRPGQRPGIPLNLLADFGAGGLLAAFGILAALHGRDRTGVGTYVDVSMYEGLMAMMGSAAAWVEAGAEDPSWGGGLLSGGMPFYDCYQTEDDRWLAVAAIEPRFFRNLCEAIGHPDLVEMQGQPECYPEVRKVFEETFRSRTLEEWMVHFEGADAAVAPVRSIPEAFHEARATGFVNATCSVGPLPRMSAWAPKMGPVVQAPGTHTREVLDEAGFSPAYIDALVRDRVVITAPLDA